MREQVQTLLAVILVLIAGFVGYTLLFNDVDQIGLSVISASGEVRRTSGSGLSEDASVGMRLHPDDELTVGANGAAELAVDAQTRVSLDAQSSIRVVGVDSSGVRIELEEGRVSARVRPDQTQPDAPLLSITSRGRAVSAADADFTVVAGESGSIGVESSRGELALQGFDDVVSLAEGSRLAAAPGQQAQAIPIPSALLLEVFWPEQARTRSAEVPVLGLTTPLAMITLTSLGDVSTSIRAGEDGRFSASVPLQEGENPIEVTAHDVMGNRTRETRALIRDTEAPAVNTEVDWGP
jgi:hypothetical protein